MVDAEQLKGEMLRSSSGSPHFCDGGSGSCYKSSVAEPVRFDRLRFFFAGSGSSYYKK